MPKLREAYQIIFNASPDALSDFEIAEKIINDFDVPKMGIELAKEVIFDIVNNTTYPDLETTRRIVSRAEAFATEVFDVDELKTDEPHMAEIEYLERKYRAPKEVKAENNSGNRIPKK